MTTELDLTLPSNPADQNKIKNAVREMEDSMTRIAAEKDLQKEIINRINEETGYAKPALRKLATMKYKLTRNKVESEAETLVETYDRLFGGN